ncbi:unnamed protein product [Adineta ricciae]|uniref:Uncharacterized protein n=1 Tax=Adineta ricciae TaxID=249248 RepID=A0A816G7Y1_ADIRI|nr:unnamed protein product [Adineta ricciae]
MLATADCTNHYMEQIVYESSWSDNTSNGISWFNLLTTEPIPEETDITDISHTPVRNNSGRSCSTSSIESCYVVLEIQRPRSDTELSKNIEKQQEEEDDDDEEEEEMEEEMEELHFAQAKISEHPIDCEELTVSLTLEFPQKEHLIEHIQEQIYEAEEHAEIIQPSIQEFSNQTYFNKAKSLSRSTKCMKAMTHVAKRDKSCSTLADDEQSNTTVTLEPIEKIIKASTQQQQTKSPVCHSNTSLDSIESKLSPSVPTQIRTTTTFSTLSTQRTSNPSQIQRPGLKMGTTTLTRTFAFDRACMEKYSRNPETKPEPVPVSVVPVVETPVKKDIGLPPRQHKPAEPSSTPNNGSNLYFRSTGTPKQSRIDDEVITMHDSIYEYQQSLSSMKFDAQSLSKTSSVLCLMKKCARTVASEYRLTTNHDKTFTEPKLLQVTYLDGRLPLRTDPMSELTPKSQTLSSSVASRLNKLGLSKMSSTQDISGSASLNGSYRKRVFNRFRNLIETHPNDPSSQSRPWQHKTIIELFNDRKQKQ